MRLFSKIVLFVVVGRAQTYDDLLQISQHIHIVDCHPGALVLIWETRRYAMLRFPVVTPNIWSLILCPVLV